MTFTDYERVCMALGMYHYAEGQGYGFPAVEEVERAIEQMMVERRELEEDEVWKPMAAGWFRKLAEVMRDAGMDFPERLPTLTNATWAASLLERSAALAAAPDAPDATTAKEEP